MNSYTLITGASSGIGRALAIEFAQNKHNLVLVARRKGRLDELSAQLSEFGDITVHTYPCDITNEEQLSGLFNYISENKLFVSTLINNAGLGDFTLFEKSSPTKNKQLVDLNINAVLNLCHHFIPDMVGQKQGRILNIASMAAYMPGPYIAVYAATKSFVLNFSVALLSELQEHGIQVSVLSPGDIKTEFQENANLSGFDAKSNITVQELAQLTYKSFIIDKENIIVPPETKKQIDTITKVGSLTIISRNLYKMRKMLAKKLGVS